MPRLFVIIYISLVCIGIGVAAAAGYSPILRMVVGWLFPTLVLGVVALPLVVGRRIKERIRVGNRMQAPA